MREIGGYLPLEEGDNEYYSNDKESYCIKLNSARYAIAASIIKSDYKQVFIPFYLCITVKDTLEKNNIRYSFYSINTNYFGLKNGAFCKRMVNKYKNVIFDNTQAFFSKPIIENGVYNVYSPRKFIGVPDGAYLICKKNEDMKRWADSLPIDRSSHRIAHIARSIEYGTNESYEGYLESEDEICQLGILRMSKVTQHLLSSVNYERIMLRRINNFRLLMLKLDRINRIRIELDRTVIPMVYPLLIDNGYDVRKKMVSNGIYCSQWWKWLIDDPNIQNLISGFEFDLSNNLIPIPIDQRYTPDDMDYIVQFIENEICC